MTWNARVWVSLGLAGALLACSDEEPKSSRDDADSQSDEESADGSLYLIGSSLQTTDTSTLLLWTSPSLDDVEFDTSDALQIVGGSDAFALGDSIYVSNSEKQNITRYELEGDELSAGDSVSFANRGLMWLSYTYLALDEKRAFVVNSDQLEMIEWNPTTMKITKVHDLSAFERDGWGAEFRGGFIRKSDGKFFFYWTYTNERVEFLNEFVMGVFDTETDELTIETQKDCPASAGFGGFFDENEDLYLIADSFGLFTQYEYKSPKPACVLRVKKGESTFDPDFSLHPAEAMGGREPWGLYYAGDGKAYTSGVDPKVFEDYEAVFEVLFAPVHTGWLIDLEEGTGERLDLPPDGVGFESHRVDDRLLVPRTSGMVQIEDIMSTESTLFDIEADGTATKLFSLPGYIAPVTRIR